MNRAADPYVSPPNDVYEPFEPYVFDYRPTPLTPFEYLLRDFFDEFFLAYPVAATHAGDHRFDNRWPDVSGTGRLGRTALLRRWMGRFGALDDLTLTPDERVDRRILLETLETHLFEEEALREETWNPLWYVELIGSGLFALLAREYAPWHHRGEAFVRRLRHLPGVVEAARQNLLGMPDRPVSRLHTETALVQLGGIPELIREAVRLAEKNRYDEDAFRLPPRFEEAVPIATRALDEFQAFLERDVLPRSRGEGRLGARPVRAEAASRPRQRPVARTSSRPGRRATSPSCAPRWCGWPASSGPRGWGDDPPRRDASDDDVVRDVLDAIAPEHRRPEELLDDCTREVARIEAFVRRNRHQPAPRAARGHLDADLHARLRRRVPVRAGPLEVGQRSLFWITPPGDDWPPERLESYLREDNERMLRLLCIHEAIPGHYLQLAAAANDARPDPQHLPVRHVRRGLGGLRHPGDDGRRATATTTPPCCSTTGSSTCGPIVNALLDVAIHAGDMTEAEAMDLMVARRLPGGAGGAGQVAAGPAHVHPASTYYIGSLEFWDLETGRAGAGRRRTAGRARACPSRASWVTSARPGFDQRAHLEAVISHGAPPIKWVRRLVLGETRVRARA